jgi:hypothetical protein
MLPASPLYRPHVRQGQAQQAERWQVALCAAGPDGLPARMSAPVPVCAQDGWSVCVVYCLDAHFITDVPKFIAGSMQVRAAVRQ